jgi:hypothetical protein
MSERGSGVVRHPYYRQLVEDRPRHVEVAILQSLLKGHAE